jgi:hypothetical protein
VTRLGNISTRAKVGRLEESQAMIGGFIVGGAGEKRVVIRALGPKLAQFGIPRGPWRILSSTFTATRHLSRRTTTGRLVHTRSWLPPVDSAI